jgi:hypothetical protein
MRLDESQLNCQIPGLKSICEGTADLPPQSLARQLKLIIRRNLSPGRERAIKNFTNSLLNQFSLFTGRNSRPATDLVDISPRELMPGDWVRVRSLVEIQATLNHWRQLKGCTFMPEMAQYCGTDQRVLKPLQRFVDERDLRVKRSSSIFLLDDVICQGTSDFGSCDRSCFYFWRIEWLEKLG